MRVKKLMVVDIDADGHFHVNQEMNGKLIRLTVPAGCETQPSAQNYSLQMVATLLLDEDHVAVADSASRQLMALANRVAATDVTVFINGPTGTGKEVLARFIHNQSSRKENAFVAVNCAAIPENMLEAILFGHEKGSFTGASTANKGIFRAADGGTLLLDEISEMPLSLQAKLLRALQERKVTPLGSQREIDVDVRVLATTNREMLQEIRDGKFREDLFYRLNVFPYRPNIWLSDQTILYRSAVFCLPAIQPPLVKCQSLMTRPRNFCCPIAGQAMYANLKMSCSVPLCCHQAAKLWLVTLWLMGSCKRKLHRQ